MKAGVGDLWVSSAKPAAVTLSNWEHVFGCPASSKVRQHTELCTCRMLTQSLAVHVSHANWNILKAQRP
jgi:hypothetical protein